MKKNFCCFLLLEFFHYIVFFNLLWAQPRVEVGNQPQIYGEGKDYYPLGILGAKGWPEIEGFRIKFLEKEGMSQKTGIQLEDLILSVQQKPLGQYQSWKLLGEILTQADSTLEKTVLSLKIRRNAEVLSFSMTIAPKIAHTETCPYSCAACQSLAKEALKVLAKAQQKEGSLPTEMAGTNGLCVVSSLGLMAFIAAGETGKSGDYAETVQNLLTFLSKNAGKDPIDQLLRKSGAKENWNQTNWAWVFSGISANLLQKSRNHPKAKSIAEKASTNLIQNQKKDSGGWGHGPGGLNALGYNELWVVTGLAFLELGLTQQNEIKVSVKAIEKAMEYLKKCVAPNGGVCYSSMNPSGPDVGRTAVALLALSALNRKDDPLFVSLSAWFLDHLDHLESAHQGYLLHLALTGLATRELGEDAFRKFWKRYRNEIFMARQTTRSGYFTPRPTSESLQNKANNDIALGEIWTTAVYALLLQLADGKLPYFRPEKK
ncbi:MAG: DUF6288 domain-containing protein [Planctomycetota bacterium]